MEGLERRPELDGMDPRALSAMRVTWSPKDTATFRKRVKQIERSHKPPLAGDGRASDNGTFRLG